MQLTIAALTILAVSAVVMGAWIVTQCRVPRSVIEEQALDAELRELARWLDEQRATHTAKISEGLPAGSLESSEATPQ